jgi:hypothetical protein
VQDNLASVISSALAMGFEAEHICVCMMKKKHLNTSAELLDALFAFPLQPNASPVVGLSALSQKYGTVLAVAALVGNGNEAKVFICCFAVERNRS